ncbi:MAG: hypothetical protein E2P03_07970 [Acidobacteria bacterium]|nr:MAG: hypothetical protein E2P03_07970 [Acidobacteriota bacterium]
MTRVPAGVKLVAAVALAYGLAAGLLAALMLGSWSRGLPITTPVQLLEPGLPFLVPGESLAGFPGGPDLPVTEGMVRTVAAANIGVFGGGSLLWLAAAAGLWRGRRAARFLGLALFGALTAIGLFNLLAEIVLVALVGSLAAAGGVPVVAATIAATLAVLVLVPMLALLTLARRSSAAAFSGDGPGRPPLVLSLVIHFVLVAVILVPSAMTPAELVPPWILLGPWSLAGAPARLVLLALAVLHGTCGWGWWSLRPWSARLSFWLNLFMVASAVGSAALADTAALTTLGAGILTPALARAALLMVAALGVTLLLAVRRAAGELVHRNG